MNNEQALALFEEMQESVIAYHKNGIEDSEFGANLRRLRDNFGFSITDFSIALGVARQTISRWEAGKSVPQQKPLMRIADFVYEATAPKEDLVSGDTLGLRRVFSILNLERSAKSVWVIKTSSFFEGTDSGFFTKILSILEAGVSYNYVFGEDTPADSSFLTFSEWLASSVNTKKLEFMGKATGYRIRQEPRKEFFTDFSSVGFVFLDFKDLKIANRKIACFVEVPTAVVEQISSPNQLEIIYNELPGSYSLEWQKRLSLLKTSENIEIVSPI